MYAILPSFDYQLFSSLESLIIFKWLSHAFRNQLLVLRTFFFDKGVLRSQSNLIWICNNIYVIDLYRYSKTFYFFFILTIQEMSNKKT